MAKLKEGIIVIPKENYRQQNGECGNKLILNEKYVVSSWYPFGGKTMVILKSGEHVYKFQLSFL